MSVHLRKDGRWIYYRLADEDVPAEARHALAWVKKALSGTPQTRKDDARLEQILKIEPEVLCRRQAKGVVLGRPKQIIHFHLLLLVVFQSQARWGGYRAVIRLVCRSGQPIIFALL